MLQLFIGFVAFMGFFLLSLTKPRLAVLILLVLVGLWPAYVAIILPSGNFGITPQRVGLLLLSLAWILQIVNVRSMRMRLSQTIATNRGTFYFAILYFSFGMITSIFSSAQVGKSFAAGVIAFGFYPMMLIFVISFFSQRKHLVQMFFTILIVGLLCEIIGIVEWIHQGNLFAIFIDPVSDTAQEMMAGKIRDDVYRIQSTFSNPLSFAEFLLLIMPISLYFISPRKCGMAIRLMAATQLILGLICIYLTASRASILLAALIIVLCVIWQNWKRIGSTAIVVGAASLILLAAILIPWELLATYIIGDSATVNSTLGRLYQLEVGGSAVLQSPFWGYGLGQGVLYVAPLESIDNYYLTVALETGLSGLAILLLFQGKALKLALRSNANSMFPSIGIFVAAAFLGIFLNELTLSIIQPFTFLFAIVGGLMVIQKSGKPAHFTVRNNE